MSPRTTTRRSAQRRSSWEWRSRSPLAGKATKRLSLLSGGEKSMTALAFLFAVFLARPCPFYILDEVEAALDDLNLDRFLSLLRRYSDRAQFIVITHQKRTMEAADWLYGVSMAQDGSPRSSRDACRRRVTKEARRRRPTTAPHRASPRSPDAALAVPREWSDLFIAGRPGDAPHPAPAADNGEPGRRRLFGRLRDSLAKTRQALGSEIQATLFSALDDHTWERLEEALIMADVGAATTASVVGTLETEAAGGQIEGPEALGERLIALLAQTARVGDGRIDVRARPTVILAVGVNGTGKTTTIGKLAWHLRRELGCSVLLAAADTFRAAAAEQLEGWARRAECESRDGARGLRSGSGRIRGDRRGAQPRHRRRDRGHGRPSAHAGRSDGRAGKGAQGDRATSSTAPPRRRCSRSTRRRGRTGCARRSCSPSSAGVSGVVLTKLDGTARGGIALAIASELSMPVKLIGIGESVEDLRPFDPEDFARALIAPD